MKLKELEEFMKATARSDGETLRFRDLKTMIAHGVIEASGAADKPAAKKKASK